MQSTVLDSISGNKLCEVVFDGVNVARESLLGGLNQGWTGITGALEQAAAAQCCEIVGSMQQMLEMTVAYAKERKQFDRPIGSFQIVQHYCAEMASLVEGARLGAYRAAWRISEGLPCRREVAVAKAWVNNACCRVTALAHQVHGAIGVTMDHDLQFYTRRLIGAASAFGDTDFHLGAVAEEAGL